MFYKPHRLQRRTEPTIVNDEYGRPVKDAGAEQWEDICGCRCDHSGDVDVQMPDGKRARADWRVVCEINRPAVTTGDILRCVEDDGTERAKGKCIKVKTLNYLPYAEIYLQS